LKYYHSAPIPLADGSIIEGGNWGRLEKQEKFGNMGSPEAAKGAAKLLTELAYDLGHKAYNPSAPSRLECCFVCPSRQAAEEFLRKNPRPSPILYEVESVDAQAPAHKTRWELFGAIQAFDNFQIINDKIREYWTYEGKDCTEILIGGSIRILRKVVAA